MDKETAELVRALAGVTRRVPRFTSELLTGTLPPERERTFAALLMDLADVLVTHASTREAPAAPVSLADRVGVTGRQLVGVSARLRTGTATGNQLREAARLLEALVEVLDLYADKLDGPPAAAERPDLPEPPNPEPPPEP
ncbi:hypothetical protein [Amycolatopsis australiensis]|uniref:Uncharacterized protein n=1 Tax=Amycolatopsis australiensis TaxID=546364 RepID=A0A1K1RRP8_9PSEU|nr:hypothetical protein [Amycolatopsis australiensis]SFW74753.1 hypothetical protein SAMN04489730_3823 [Amycolatopsis australiensis]